MTDLPQDKTAVEAPTPAARPDWRSSLARVQNQFPILQTFILIALVAVASVTIDGFMQADSLRSTLLLASLLGVGAVGQTLVVLLGGIDLSVPAIISASNLFLSELLAKFNWPIVPAILVILVLGFAVGALSGYVSHRFTVQPLIVTLGVGAVVSGVVIWLTASSMNLPANPPEWLTNFASADGQTFGLGIPPLVFFWVLVAVAMHLVLRRTVFGRRIYFTGSNPAAARLAHVNTLRVWTTTFAVSGAFAALTGMILVGFSGSGDPSIGDEYLFTTLAAVIVGGTSFRGARGSYWHTAMGALIVTVLTTILIGNGLSSAGEQVAYGLVVFLLAGAYGRDRRVRDQI
jgi:ribose transport system permease protein